MGDNTLHKNKKIYQFDLEGNFIKEYDSVNDAVIGIGATKWSVYNSLTRNNRCNYKFYLSFNRDFKKSELEYLRKEHKTPVYQFDLEGKFIKKHESSMDASKSLEIKYTSIHNAIHLKNVCNKKFYFSRTIDFVLIPDKKRLSISKPVYQFDLKGNFIKEYESIKSASLILNINRSDINNSIHQHSIKTDFYFSRTREFIVPDKRRIRGKRNDKTLYQFDLEGNFVQKYESINSASLILKINPSAISSSIPRNGCVKGRYYFSYDKEFTVPAKKAQFNPLLNGGKGNLDFVTDTHNEIINDDFDDEDEY